jgi:hypothetical protein
MTHLLVGFASPRLKQVLAEHSNHKPPDLLLNGCGKFLPGHPSGRRLKQLQLPVPRVSSQWFHRHLLVSERNPGVVPLKTFARSTAIDEVQEGPAKSHGATPTSPSLYREPPPASTKARQRIGRLLFPWGDKMRSAHHRIAALPRSPHPGRATDETDTRFAQRNFYGRYVAVLYHTERPHQGEGIDNEILCRTKKRGRPKTKRGNLADEILPLGEVRCHQRLGGLLKSYSRKAA